MTKVFTILAIIILIVVVIAIYVNWHEFEMLYCRWMCRKESGDAWLMCMESCMKNYFQ